MSLFQRRENLVRELNAVNAQIIAATLEHGADAALAAALPAAGKRAAKGARKGRPAKAKAEGGERRKWFERGEMLELTRKVLANKTMTQADLVRALAAAKGYDKSLSDEDKGRFASASYQAIAASIKGKQLARQRDGQIALKKAAA
jgi:hypothetical protein